MIINDIANSITNLADGTYIIRPDGTARLLDDNREGYWVGVRPLTTEDLTELNVFGVWTNAKGLKEFDLTDFEKDLESAMSLAIKRNQVAIWDIANGVEIPVTK